MLHVRQSPDQRRNARIRELVPSPGEGNTAWLRRAKIRDGVLLLGGSSLVEFRIRFAQARARRDLLPSFWSMAGLLCDGSLVRTVADLRDLDRVPVHNGVQTVGVEEFDDPDVFPNIAVIQFARQHRVLREHIDAIESQRSVVDIPELILPWLGYLWGTASHGNPLVEGKGLPSAVLIETAHAMAGIDLTPGLASSASCPEAIWQAAIWWTSYYEDTAESRVAGKVTAMSPVGCYACRQPEAYVGEREVAAPSRKAPSPGRPARRAKR